MAGSGSGQGLEVGAPAAEGADVARAGQRQRFADEAVHAAGRRPVPRCPGPAGWGSAPGSCPPACSGMSQTSSAMAVAAVGHAQQAGLGRRGAGQREQPVARCGGGGLQQGGAALGAAARSAAGPLRCAPTTASGSVGRWPARRNAGGGGAQGRPVAPSTWPSDRQRCPGCQRGVETARGDEAVTPNGRPPGGGAGRQRQRAPAQQVDEVGVQCPAGRWRPPGRRRPRRSWGAWARWAPAAHRPAPTAAASCAAGGCRRYRARKVSVALKSQRAAPITRRTVGSSASGWRASRSLHHRVPFGHPGAVVQQAATSCSGSKSIGTSVCPASRRRCSASGPGGGRSRWSASSHRGAWHAHAQPAGSAAGPGCEGAVVVVLVGAFDHRQHGGGVVDRQRKDRHAVQTAAGRQHPAVLTRPGVGLSPTRWLKPAGTRPEPAVSVPSAKGSRPRATTDRRARAGPAADPVGPGCWAPRRRASGCPPGRWRTGRGWSCPAAPHRRHAGAAPRWRPAWPGWRRPGRRRWWASRPRRCCPSPRTARPTAASAPAAVRRRVCRPGAGARVLQLGCPRRRQGTWWIQTAASSGCSGGCALAPAPAAGPLQTRVGVCASACQGDSPGAARCAGTAPSGSGFAQGRSTLVHRLVYQHIKADRVPPAGGHRPNGRGPWRRFRRRVAVSGRTARLRSSPARPGRPGAGGPRCSSGIRPAAAAPPRCPPAWRAPGRGGAPGG
jgi:hypothetical protein